MTGMIRLLALSAFVWATVIGAAQAQAPNDYSIGPQDALAITVFGEAELSGKYTVEQDGTFTFPQIGRIKAGGLSLRALEAELKKRLADGYLVNPQVAVAIDTYRSQRILVIGEVRLPGEIQLNGEMTLMAALARAGSVTPAASHEVLIVRSAKRGAQAPLTSRPLVPVSEQGDADVIRIDLAELQAGNMSLNVTLQDGDTVNVPKAQSVFVTGQVKAPGAYSAEPGTTVLQILSLAGGLTDRGSDGRIRIQRIVNGKQVEVAAKLSDVVKPGDTVIVRERFF